jgi:hypothetical protein
LAAVARANAQRHQQRKESAGQMDDRRERHLEAGHAGQERLDADHLGDYIFLNIADGTKDVGTLSLWALDRTKGKVLWKKPLGAGDHNMRKQNMSSPSPVTDGRNVWVLTWQWRVEVLRFRRH